MKLFNTLLPSVLLLALPQAVFADEESPEEVRYLKAMDLRITKRDPFALFFEPHYIAMPLNVHAGSLVKRQSCPIGSSTCYTGCCDVGTVCGIYGGEKGCCPIGKRCGSVSGCSKSDEVDCSTHCCPAGSTCATDASGNPSCSTGNTGNGCADPGFSPCTIFQGCCPTGSQCVLPKNCNVPCSADDPICGDGCCPKGSVCTSQLTCAKDNTNTFTTLKPQTTAVPTRTVGTSSTDIPVPTDTVTSTTRNFLDGTTTTTGSSTTSTTSTTTTTTRRTIVLTQNAAPTMGAVLGGGLGLAAGVLGVLAI